MNNKRLLIALILGGVLFLGGVTVYLLAFRGGGETLEPPKEYILGADQVESLSAALGQESGELTEMKTPGTEDAGGSSSRSSAVDEACYYTYQKLDTGGDSVRQYVEKLTAEENGFLIVDEDGKAANPPNYANGEGALSLAKAASEDGRLLRMDISWTDGDCRITLTRPEGTIGKVGETEKDPITYVQAVDFLKSLSPAKLGLEAESLRDYSVYPMDGAVLVDGILCLKLQVYPPRGEGQANVIAGTYLLSGDKAHLYRLQDGAVSELPL